MTLRSTKKRYNLKENRSSCQLQRGRPDCHHTATAARESWHGTAPARPTRARGSVPDTATALEKSPELNETSAAVPCPRFTPKSQLLPPSTVPLDRKNGSFLSVPPAAAVPGGHRASQQPPLLPCAAGPPRRRAPPSGRRGGLVQAPTSAVPGRGRRGGGGGGEGLGHGRQHPWDFRRAAAPRLITRLRHAAPPHGVARLPRLRR